MASSPARRTAQNCRHYGLKESEATKLSDPEPRYYVWCSGCDLQETVFECQSCGRRNPEPMTCCMPYE